MTEKKNINQGRTRNKRYLIWLLIVLIVIDLIDAYSTNYITVVSSSVATEF